MKPQDLISNVCTFEQLYVANRSWVHALCLRRLRNPEDAEEVTQDVFLRAWRKLPDFNGLSGAATWLWSITMNCLADVVRYRTRLKRAGENIELDENLSSRDVDPLLRLNLLNCISALSPSHREHLLRQICGKPYDKSAASRARRQMREMLGARTGLGERGFSSGRSA